MIKKFTKLFSKEVTVIVLLFLIAIPVLTPLIKSGFFPTQDFIHVARLYEMDKSLKEGQFPVRWISDFRYGEPTFNFYAPLPFYVGSLIHNLGFNFLQTIKILFGLGFILSGVAMYFLAKEFFGKLGGLISATLYIYAPYHAVDVYVRGALSESIALIFLPLIFLASFKLSLKPHKLNIAFLSLSLGGLFLTHNIMTLLFFPFFLGWLVFLILTKKDFRLTKYYLMAIVLALGLAATFLLPAFWEKDLTQSSKMITGYFDYRGHFVEIKQFFSTFWGYGASLWGGQDDMSFQVGLVHWGVLGLSLGTLLFLKNRSQKVVLIGFLVLEFLFSLFMQHNKSTPIWTHLSLLAYTQFPWRFLGISIFFISFIGGLVGSLLPKKLSVLGVALIGAIIIFNVNFFKPESYYSDSIDAHYIFPREDQLPKDYLPFWVSDVQRERITLPHAVSGKAEVSDFWYKSTHASFKLSAFSDVDIEVPVSYFPNWQVTANGKQVDTETPDKYGLVRFKITPGNYLVKLTLTDTPARQVGNILSLVSVLLLAALLFSKKIRVKYLLGKK